MSRFLLFLFTFCSLLLLGALLWQFPMVGLSFIYPAPFLFTFLLGFYLKIFFGVRFGRKGLFAISNIVLLTAIPLALSYSSYPLDSFLLYSLFHLFLSIPLSKYVNPSLQLLYDRIDFLGQIAPPKSVQTRLFLETLNQGFKIHPYPSFQQISPPVEFSSDEEVFVFLWNLPGKPFCLSWIEELNQQMLIEEDGRLTPLPEEDRQESIDLFFQKYPNLILYGKFLPSGSQVNGQELKGYIVMDIIPKQRGKQLQGPLPWQDIQSICKVFGLPKVGEMGAFKGQKLKQLIFSSRNYPEGLLSGYLRPWKPNKSVYYFILDPDLNRR